MRAFLKEKMKLEIDINAVMGEFTQLPNHRAPQSKGEKRELQRALGSATVGNPLCIYVGSCPDYSYENGLYTHRSLGEGVPLLTQYHATQDTRLLTVLDRAGVPYRYTIMVADVEATDEVFARKFTSGDEEEFLGRCRGSVQSTGVLLEQVSAAQALNGELRSNSFFDEFGRDKVLSYQEQYLEVLRQRHEEDSSFRIRVSGDTSSRLEMYAAMYSGIIPQIGHLNEEQRQFLAGRTLRTMAQYLALARLIAEASPNAIIINHPTRNNGMFNDRNKFLLPTDGPQPQRTIPVFEMTQEVYK